MSASKINDLINPARLRLGIKRAFTGDVNEILSEIFQNAMRAGARNIRITTDDRGFTYQDDGHGLRDESDFEALLKLGESGWDQHVKEDHQSMGLGVHSLLALDEVQSVTFSSNLLSLTIDAHLWWDWQYAAGWRESGSTFMAK
jgi:Histidine kinase-, DNA gyrase B-, and HSP90-like ATPase